MLQTDVWGCTCCHPTKLHIMPSHRVTPWTPPRTQPLGALWALKAVEAGQVWFSKNTQSTPAGYGAADSQPLPPPSPLQGKKTLCVQPWMSIKKRQHEETYG